MADEEITQAQREAKLALLRQIASTIQSYSTPANIRDMAYAYALVIGASPSRLPGAPIEVSTT